MRSGLGEIVIVVDTSGSIGTAELERFAGEITRH
jgi:predicted metal-dependent peptidase